MRLRATLVALALAAVAVAATGWSPLCVLYPRWSPEWIVLGCWYDEPDPPPYSNEG